MTSPRLWILLLAATSFLAGSAAGILGFVRWRPVARERGPFEDYGQHLVATFDLPEDRVRHLRAILERYHADIEELRSRHMGELEPDLARAGLMCRERIRNYVLPPEARSGFDSASPLPSLPPR